MWPFHRVTRGNLNIIMYASIRHRLLTFFIITPEVNKGIILSYQLRVVSEILGREYSMVYNAFLIHLALIFRNSPGATSYNLLPISESPIVGLKNFVR